jgi:hypothetical protein
MTHGCSYTDAFCALPTHLKLLRGSGRSSNAAHTESAVWRRYRSATEAREQVFRKSLLDLLSALGDFFPSACSPLPRLGPGEDYVWVGSRIQRADFVLPTCKREWFGFDPLVWSVFANFFMLWAGFRIKWLKTTNGRNFAIAFAIAAFVPVGLLFIPEFKVLR